MGPYGQTFLSMPQCRDFAEKAEEFFKRLFEDAGLPDKGAWIVK